MKRFFIAICMVFMMCEYAEAYCSCFCCEDMASIMLKANQEVGNFKKLDQETANEINKIKNEVKEKHDDVEEDSKTILENIRKLNRQYYIVEQNILHNQILINELQNIVIDAVSTSTEAKDGKNGLKILKRKLQE
jgi:hypothetical protein